MFKNLYILFVVLCVSLSLYAKSGEDSYRVFSPKYIYSNSSFDLSIITKNSYPEATEFDFYIIPDNKLELNSLQLRSYDNNFDLRYYPSTLKGYIGSVYKAEIDLTQLTAESFFQVVSRFYSSSSNKASVKFYGVFKNDEKTLGYLQKNADSSSTNEDKFIPVNLDFYKPQKSAGKCLKIENEASLDFPLPEFQKDKLLFEFWFKTSNKDFDFLNIINNETQQGEFKLSINAFQMLNVVGFENDQVYINPFFISKDSWYHFAVEISKKDNTIEFYCNGNLISKNKVNNILNTSSLDIKIGTDEQNKSFQIDLLRFVDFGNTIETSVQNSNYIEFSSDSSSVIAGYSFDDNELSLDKSVTEVNLEGIQIVKSTAPIFARAPELNITILSNLYELEWSGGDYNQAETYVLQKSVEGSDYYKVFTFQSYKTPDKVYSYLDKIDENSDVVFYRVKQINSDGTAVYSSQVKVGQGIMEPFTVDQNFPNPFNPKTSISIELLEDAEVEITVYNLEGKEVQKLEKGYLSKGKHTFSFDGSELPSGVYLYKVATPDYTQTKKMILAK